jgi:signal transduction histidine kinase/CheY-like chemotaxis protein
MSVATAVLAVALLLAASPQGDTDIPLFAAHTAGLVSAVAFGLGFAPPRPLRLSWRSPDDAYLQQATIAVLGATDVEGVAAELLPPTVRIVGSEGAVVVDEDGAVVASHGTVPVEEGDRVDVTERSADGQHDREIVPLGERRGHLVVWTSPYTPYFGSDELGLLQTMGAVATLALDRCDLLAEERAQRASLERAREAAEQAREEAHEANLAKSGFLSRMSHEFRTPLNAILGFGQLLESSELSDDDREGVGHILKAGRHLLALINDVLDLSRIEAGTFTISLEPVQASELIEDTAALVRPQMTSRSITFTTGSLPWDAYVSPDRQRCVLVLLNLLPNADKNNYDGGTVDVSCTLSSQERTLRISVRDSGPGIDPERQQQLFEPFQRLGAESSGVEGTGLGLALSKQLVERLGGAMGVETAIGQGATFWIELPLAESPPGRDDERTAPESLLSAEPRTLLLVEDNLANLRVVEALLRRRPGITVMPAMHGTLALDLASEHQPDLIVLDLHLPDLSGREVLSRLKADPRTRHIPVVIASADATPGRVRQLREAGATDYLTKPLDLHEFLAMADNALAGEVAAGDRTDGEGTVSKGSNGERPDRESTDREVAERDRHSD